MFGQLLIASEIEFNKISGSYTIHDVLNEIVIDTLPYVCSLKTMIKLHHIPEHDPIEIQIIIYNKDREILVRTAPKTSYNTRKFDEIPAVDLMNVMKLPFCSEGNHLIEMLIDGNCIFTYPLMVRLREGG